MCLPSPISITVAIVVITVFTKTTVTAKLGFASNRIDGAQYECCSLPSSSSERAKDTILTVSSRHKSVVLEPAVVSSPCIGGSADTLYEWCMPEDAPASMMFVGDTWHTRAAVVVGIAVDEALYVQRQQKWLQQAPQTAEDRARFVDHYAQQDDEQQARPLQREKTQQGTVAWTFLVKTTCRSTNTTDTQTVQLRIVQDESEREAVELLLNPSLFPRWTIAERERLEERLSNALTAATLTPEKTRVVAIVHEVARLPLDGRWRVVFHAEERDASDAVVSVVRARDAAGILRARTTAKNELRIERIEMRTCQLSCSGNGVCDSSTKRCVCEEGWLPSPLSLLRSGGRTEDCSWSTMTMASFVIVLLASVALLVMATRKHKSRRSLLLSRRAARRRQRYEHLRSDEVAGEGVGVRRTSRTRKRSGNGPTLVALPPRSWSSSSLSSDECGDLVPIRRGAP